MGIAIIGMSPSCKDAPWFDDKWEIWGLPWHAEYWARCDRLFEIHEPTKGWNYIEKAKEKAESTGATLYLRENYPFDKVDCDYFDSSMAYMMALAISEKPSKIGLWGIDMNDDQYQHQRPNMEYLIGLARGKGIEVLIHESSPLCKNEINYGLKEWRLPHTQN